MSNKLIVGTTTSGKSTAEARAIIEEAVRGETAIVICDPHRRSLAWWVYTHALARGLESRLFFDRLSDLSRVLGWNFFEPSKAKDALQRLAENDETAHAATEFFCHRRGIAGLEKSPLTEEFVTWALKLFLAQEDRGVTVFSQLAFAFSPGTPEFAALVDHCQDDETARVFRTIASGKIARGQYASAARFIREVVNKPAFFTRDGGCFNWKRFIQRRGILVVEGGSLGNVSFDAMRVIFGAIILATIRTVRNRRRPLPRVRLVIDEASNASLVNNFLIRALAETQ